MSENILPTGMKEPEDCQICGASQPYGHVVIHDADGNRVGRVCSKHRLSTMFRAGFMLRIEGPAEE